MISSKHNPSFVLPANHHHVLLVWHVSHQGYILKYYEKLYEKNLLFAADVDICSF